MTAPLTIDYYTDILCVWAWIAQRRVEELHQHWGERVVIRPRYVDVFGDVDGRIGRQWGERGGYAGYAAHVLEAAQPFEDAPVNPDVWHRVRPVTSLNAHLVLKAVTRLQGDAQAARLALRLRRAFFVEGEDIGRLPRVRELALEAGTAASALDAEIASGRAQAALMADYQQAHQEQIQGSPSWVLNQGRQKLYGNVGYRVLHANVEELIRRPPQEASWC